MPMQPRRTRLAGAELKHTLREGAGSGRVERVVTLDEALDVARHIHRLGNLDEAQAIYQAVLARRPDDPVALQFLGVLTHQRGDTAQAMELLRRAIDARPDDPGAFNNFGNMLLEAGQVDAAAEAYRRCLDLAPDFVETHNNLGTILRARGELDAAERAYVRALELRPEFAEAYYNMANLRYEQNRVTEAAYFAFRAITLNPAHAPSRNILAVAYCKLGAMDKAIEIYREWLADEPDNPIARHHLAACTGEAVPARAADAYVETTFDAFAASFDSNLEMLNYRAPELVAQAVSRSCPAAARQWRVLDAGCGTGLCGKYLAPHASELTGVDLSGNMLAKAAQRQVYDVLEKAELTGYLESQPVAFDLIVSADTLCYFGALDSVLRAAHHALDAGGKLIFTLEAATDAGDGADCRINPHGRFSHARPYVEAVLAEVGFFGVGVEHVVLRNEGGNPVAGLLIVAHKQG